MQNLLFKLRGATLSRAVTNQDYAYWGPGWTLYDIPEDSDYVESGFMHWAFSGKGYGPFFSGDFVKLDDLWPFNVNYQLHNWLYDTNIVPSSFVWQTNFATIPAPAVLGLGDPYWISQDLSDPGGLGITVSGENSKTVSLQSGFRNMFGLLAGNSLCYSYNLNLTNFDSAPEQWLQLAPGNSITFAVGPLAGYWSQFDQPLLVPAGYYFAPVLSPGTDSKNFFPLVSDHRYPLPAIAGFPTNSQTPLMVANVGEPIIIGGWSRQTIFNNDPHKYAFIGQYFEKAFKIDTNGIPTTNETGVLSPYGEFFPTEPGPTALVTMTNWGENECGTAILHVIALNVDGNHDGVMDFTYSGPDQTTPHRPFRFWVNDDNDSGDTGGNDIPGKKGSSNNGQDNHVNGVRDLVDFFPVYLNIRSLLQTLPDDGLAVKLRQEDEALNYIDPEFYFSSALNPTNCLLYLTDTNLARFVGRSTPTPASTYRITSSGVALGTTFVGKIRDQGKGMILIEARTNTTKPLVLEVRQGTNLIAQAKLYLSISSVEKMFRQKNLIRVTFGGSAGFADRLTDECVLNEPDTNDKNFVFLHGYSNNPDQARGLFAEIFKRMYWSGSHAKFYGVTWKASDSQGDLRIAGISVPGISPNYHTNVYHAFQTAPYLAEFLATLTNGPTTVGAHSLGNMVVLTALNDFSAPISNYFMLNAAVAMEAIDGFVSPTNDMVFSDWQPYADRLYAANWNTLFTNTEFRSTLKWNGRLTNFNGAQVYNFCSSGEEVLREWPVDPPTNILSYAAQVWEDFWVSQSPVASYIWVWQEKAKGRANRDDRLGSTHGGWKFNISYDVGTNHLAPSQAALLPDSQLRTNAFFDFASATFTADLALYGNFGNAYAFENRYRILADAIPALTWVIGSHSVTNLDIRFGETRNFDMNLLYQNGWPLSRPQSGLEAFKWYHSDFREVSYTYAYKLFNQFVTLGNLK